MSTSPTFMPSPSALRASVFHTVATCLQAGHQGAKLYERTKVKVKGKGTSKAIVVDLFRRNTLG